MKFSVKKVYAGIGTIFIFMLAGMGGYKNPDMIPELLYPLIFLVSALFGFKSASVVAEKYIERGKKE